MTHLQLPPWFRLLKYWQYDQEEPRSSLSFSLLVGAYDAFGFGFNQSESVEEFSRNLVAEMQSQPIDGLFPVAVPCPYIGRAVSLVDVKESRDYDPLDFDELWSRYSSGLRSRKYSVQTQKFYDFSPADLQWMSIALSATPTDEYKQFAGITG